MNFLRGLWSRKADMWSSALFVVAALSASYVTSLVFVGGGVTVESIIMGGFTGVLTAVFAVSALMYVFTERRPTGPDSSELCFVWSSKS